LQNKPSARDLLNRLRQYRGKLPADFAFNRNDANRRR
jgi:antitoxin MazE